MTFKIIECEERIKRISMAVIVKHKKTQKRFVFLGVGYGMYKATRPSFIGGNLFPDEEEGESRIAAVCDKAGNILWFSANQLVVVEVDGIKLEDLSNIFDEEEKKIELALFEKCPGCNNQVSIYEKKCPHCGLLLVDRNYEKISEIAKKKNID